MERATESHSQLRDLNSQARSLRRNDPREGLRLATVASSVARAEGNQLELARALTNAGACNLYLGGLEEAHRLLSDADALLSARRSAKQEQIEVLTHLVRTCFQLQEYTQSMRHVHEALRLSQELGDVRIRAEVLNDAGTVYGQLESYEQALQYFLESRKLLEQSGARQQPSPLNNIGNIYLNLGEPDKAIRYFRQALTIFETDEDRLGIIIALGNVGRACEALGDHHEALEVYARCVDLARKLPSKTYLPPALSRRAALLGELGRVDEAFELFEEALSCYRGEERSFKDEVLLAMAELHLACGRPQEAEPLLRQALDLCEQANVRGQKQNVLERLSQALEAQGRFRESLEAYRTYHQLFSKSQRQLHSARIQTLLLHQELEQSKREGELLEEMNGQLTAANVELRALHETLRAQNAVLERLSLEDPLTGLFNRRHLEQRLTEEFARLERYGSNFCLVMVDIDDFKGINDRYTHVVGDKILVRFAAILAQHTRETDVRARVGGEEFVLLLPSTSLHAAVSVAEKIRASVERHPWTELASELIVTVSAGVAEAEPGQQAAELLQMADRELYRAKRMGKNLVRSSGGDRRHHQETGR